MNTANLCSSNIFSTCKNLGISFIKMLIKNKNTQGTQMFTFSLEMPRRMAVGRNGCEQNGTHVFYLIMSTTRLLYKNKGHAIDSCIGRLKERH